VRPERAPPPARPPAARPPAARPPARPPLTPPARRRLRTAELLLRLRGSIENWDEVAASRGLVGWNVSLPTCVWSGVQCDERGRVAEVLLPCDEACAAPARGVLPPELAGMDALRSLSLSGNEFRGALPPAWGAPGAFGGLLSLNLDYNNLTGTPLAGWARGAGALATLQLLRLGNNDLEGPLPADFAAPRLLVLRVFGNRVNGSLADDLLARLPQLTILVLSDNELTGAAPAAWAAPGGGGGGALAEIYLDGNRLSGGLPPWGAAGALPRLEQLALSRNPALDGELPETWAAAGAFSALRRLQLADAGLVGELPPAWAAAGALPRLEEVDLARNSLAGSVEAWADKASLERLSVRPGNEALCAPPDVALPFRLCDGDDVLCARNVAPELAQCTGGGGGNPVAAIAVPVALGAAALAAAAAALAVWLPRRRLRRAAAKAAERPVADAAHPFDSLEGQRRLTSPFAAAAAPASFAAINDAAAAPPAAGSASSASSATSLCLRIRTHSFERSGSIDAAVAAAAAEAGALELAVWRAAPRAAPGAAAGLAPPTPGAGSPVRERESAAGGRRPPLAEPDLEAPFDDWEVDPAELEFLTRPDGSAWELGAGGHGAVFKALRGGVQPVAVKVLRAGRTLSARAAEDFKREVAILRACRDANIVQFQVCGCGAGRGASSARFCSPLLAAPP
jgi:hypothetical protein